jgi:hypothetical protein
MQPLSEYLRNKEIRNSLPYRYLGYAGTGFYFMDGEALSHEDIERLLPIKAKVTLWNFNPKGPNPDRTRII